MSPAASTQAVAVGPRMAAHFSLARSALARARSTSCSASVWLRRAAVIAPIMLR